MKQKMVFFPWYMSYPYLICSYINIDLNRSKIEKFLYFEAKLIKLSMCDMYEGNLVWKLEIFQTGGPKFANFPSPLQDCPLKVG